MMNWVEIKKKTGKYAQYSTSLPITNQIVAPGIKIGIFNEIVFKEMKTKISVIAFQYNSFAVSTCLITILPFSDMLHKFSLVN